MKPIPAAATGTTPRVFLEGFQAVCRADNGWGRLPRHQAARSASTGAAVQVLSGSAYGFDGQVAITSDGTNVWVPNEGGESITGFPAA